MPGSVRKQGLPQVPAGRRALEALVAEAGASAQPPRGAAAAAARDAALRRAALEEEVRGWRRDVWMARKVGLSAQELLAQQLAITICAADVGDRGKPEARGGHGAA